eukprot:gb/GFBE01070119.1/.p1 GENE.gb/GFBE01070119.1/~~gb/GFBE01070119.1/.p1  ORF type:complete len:269 (+),score=26.95 gb/GFBE01070119.1/:1-807(+)
MATDGDAMRPSSSSSSRAGSSLTGLPSDRVSAARASAARLAASVVNAGRLAATAARARPGTPGTPGSPSRKRLGVGSPGQGVCNEVANRAVAAAALRACAEQEKQPAGCCASPLKYVPATRVDPAAAPARRLDFSEGADGQPEVALDTSPAPVIVASNSELKTRVPSRESSADETALCEWDVRVENTFIRVIPMAKHPLLAHTASAPGCLGVCCYEGNSEHGGRGRSGSRRRQPCARRGGRQGGRRGRSGQQRMEAPAVEVGSSGTPR